jgi:CTP synthase
VAVSNEFKREKIAMFCDVESDAIFSAIDVENIYEVPLRFFDEGIDQKVAIMLHLPAKNANLTAWNNVVHTMANPAHAVKIGIVGKYADSREAYKSLIEALTHGGIANKSRVDITLINAEEVTNKTAAGILQGLDGLVVPGGFDVRGVEGKIAAAKYARENKVPFFGICLGMQCAVIEFSRNMAEMPKANSEEFAPQGEDKVIYLMTEWYDHRSGKRIYRNAESNKGGTMRLGAYPCRLVAGTLAEKAYGREEIEERHRHRFEFNNKYKEGLASAGMHFSGLSPDGELVEIVELSGHPWFLGCQFHPEFKSSPMNPHPLFRDFIKASLENSKG